MNLSKKEQVVLEHFMGYKSRIVASAHYQQNFRTTRKEVWFVRGRFVAPSTILIHTVKNRYDSSSFNEFYEFYTFTQERLLDASNNLTIFSTELTNYSMYKTPIDKGLGYSYVGYRRASNIISSLYFTTSVVLQVAHSIYDPLNIDVDFDFIIHDARYPNIITGLPVGFSFAGYSGSVLVQMYNHTGTNDTKQHNSAVSYDYNTYSNGLSAPSNTVYPIYDIETVKQNIRKHRYYL